MTANTKGIIVVVSVALLAGGAWMIFHKKPNASKEDKIYQIISMGGISTVDSSVLNSMNTYDDGYLDAWLAALQSKAEKFVYNSKQYLSTGGKAVK